MGDRFVVFGIKCDWFSYAFALLSDDHTSEVIDGLVGIGYQD